MELNLQDNILSPQGSRDESIEKQFMAMRVDRTHIPNKETISKILLGIMISPSVEDNERGLSVLDKEGQRSVITQWQPSPDHYWNAEDDDEC